jgi:hypothetical protein
VRSVGSVANGGRASGRRCGRVAVIEPVDRSWGATHRRSTPAGAPNNEPALCFATGSTVASS